jgi:hypothetical protein
MLGLGRAEAVSIYQSEQHLVSETLPAQLSRCLDHRMSLIGSEVVGSTYGLLAAERLLPIAAVP